MDNFGLDGVPWQDVMEVSIGSPKPYDAEVEYLENDTFGTFLLSTGVPLLRGRGFDVIVSHLSTSESKWVAVVGTKYDATRAMFYLSPNSTSTSVTINFDYWNSAFKLAPNINTTNPIHIGIGYVDSTYQGYVGTTTKVVGVSDFPGTANDVVYLWPHSESVYFRCYGLRVYESDGSLLFDGIPVRKNGIGYLYDKVSHQLFGNQGTGEFLYGSDVRCYSVEKLEREGTTLWRKLPYDSEVEHLESNGTQYIDTGVTVTNAYTVSVKLQFGTTAATECVWSARSVNPTSNTLTFFKLQSGQGRFDYGATQNTYPFNYSNWSTMHRYKAVANKFYIDDVLMATATASTFTSGSNVLLLASHNVNSPYDMVNFASAKLYGAKILDGDGNTVRDYIPVRVGTTGYLFDKVSWTLFGNEETGSFAYGADKH